MVFITGFDDAWLHLIHSNIISIVYSNIVNNLEHPQIIDQELLLSTCPKQVQNEYMGEKTESGVYHGL